MRTALIKVTRAAIELGCIGCFLSMVAVWAIAAGGGQ